MKVTALGQTYRYQGMAYGPFTASPETPFLEVPEGLALAVGASLYDPELAQAQDEIQPEGADIQELLAANESLKTALDEANTELELTRSDFIKCQNDLDGLKARVTELEAGGAAADLTGALQTNSQAIKEKTFDTSVAISPATSASAESDPASKPAAAPKKASKP
ncbi:hypothetical protein [Deinococcus alpinitundrae]|uniref:hypothetical protein n=1 Tax=Deinococcus alpinitundrae TaxID=468913 RepID=UPI00137A86AA|nr:hypothetical protein [Deinococcus alpinitundrae]